LELLGAELLAAACRRALVLGGAARRSQAGVALVDTSLPLAEEARAVSVMDVNGAGADGLAALPEIGPVLARRIVEERSRAGAFASADDLRRRVEGIGPERVRRLAGCLSFESPECSATVDLGGSAAELFTHLAARWCDRKSPQDAVLATLDRLFVMCAGRPHPSSAAQRVRQDRREALDRLRWQPTSWIGVLDGEGYAPAVLQLLQQSRTSVDLCVFHMALGAETKALVSALADAAGRGVVVRVLLDRDRNDDPYQSTLINSKARKVLEAGGVKVRQDAPNVLLHSKFMIIDGERAVLGSHNWSAGSLAGYDDTSVVLESRELAATLTARFLALWR
jgi:hypothetical protein